MLTPPAFDAAGYLAAVDRCRQRFPGLRVLSGVEVGEPHRHADAVTAVLAVGTFDRVLGSLHCLPIDGGFTEPPGLYRRHSAAEVVRRYLAEIARMVDESDLFSVLAHVDYPLRYWPTGAGPVDVSMFEAEFRHALRTTARAGRVLEVNTRIPSIQTTLLRWWCDEGGAAVTFGSDAHRAEEVAGNFREAAELASAHGFRPTANPYEPWIR